jgi:uncharacterized protein
VRSRLYVGSVAHTRSGPRKNAFRYGIYFLMLDLAELAEVDRAVRLFSYNRPGVVSFWDRDHGPRDGSPLRPWIDALVARAGIDLSGGRVEILAFPRVLGGRFYPISLWYCFAADGSPRAVLAEVQNTVGGHHNYLLHNNGAPLDWSSSPHAEKVFYVSPFISMDARYEFKFSEPGETLRAAVFDHFEGEYLLTAAIDVAARPLDDGALIGTLLRYGPMSARAWVLILLQALRLVVKGIRYHPPLPPPDEETTV